MKRKQPMSKTIKNNIIVSATHTKNYMIGDTLIDYLKYHTTVQNNQSSFISFIMNKGIEFETKIIKYINDNKIPVISVSDSITDNSIKRTIELMELGTPIIHSAPFKNNKNNTQGIIDILIRSDYLDKLVDECPLIASEKITGKKKYHYVVIDIKFSTLYLTSDGRHILNIKNYKAYKAQLLIYTEAVGEIQGYKSPYAFILGRRWEYTAKKIKYNSTSCLSKLGVVDYKGVDSFYIEKTKKAIEWVRDVKTNGHNWILPTDKTLPSKIELYPNMCNDSLRYQKEKEKIAHDIGDISCVWYCNEKNRQLAINKGVYSWKDVGCTSAIMGINGIRAVVIDNILDINRQAKDKIRPLKIKTDMFNWRNNYNEVFVDFETLCDIFDPFDNLPYQEYNDQIFMIGIYYKRDDKLEYRNFTCNKNTREEEHRIMDEFMSFIKLLGNPKIWYWCAETNFWERSKNRQPMQGDWTLTNCVNLQKIFKTEPIVIKDCFNYGLKSVAMSMKKHGFITTDLSSDCKTGMNACVDAWKCYRDEVNPVDSVVMKDIMEYNKFDCKVLYDILAYIRNNH